VISRPSLIIRVNVRRYNGKRPMTISGTEDVGMFASISTIQFERLYHITDAYANLSHPAEYQESLGRGRDWSG
jgi:hypothetical protein